MSTVRRDFLRGAGAIAGCALGRVGIAEAEDARSGRAAVTRKEWDAIVSHAGEASFSCVATPETVEGPFYYESSPERRAIAERHPGTALRLGITLGGLLRGNRCFPLAGAVVDVWQTDAAGLYSNVGADLQSVDTVGQRFLRGHQFTDDRGYVEFDTIVPGWEIVPAPAPINVAMRTTHIHVKVFHGRKVLTTQLYFPDPLLDRLYATVEPYRSHRLMTAPGLAHPYERIHNRDDMFYRNDRARPMTVTHASGALVANATIGMVSQGNRGFTTLFR